MKDTKTQQFARFFIKDIKNESAEHKEEDLILEDADLIAAK